MADPAQSRLRLHITPTAEWHLRSGHPWLYSESVVHQNRDGEPGELAIVYDRHDNFLAIGLYDPFSALRVRLLYRGKPVQIDDDWWKTRLAEATGRRAGLFDARTTGFRLINGESDGWPGLVLDRYDNTGVMKVYTAAWLPRARQIAGWIRDGCALGRVVLRLSRNIQALAKDQYKFLESQILDGPDLRDRVVFLENGLRFEADVFQGQKTGFFLDQRENRQRVESLAAGRDVLNAFSFSGGFSLYAARGGARSVTDLDISEHALEAARRNFARNRSISTVAGCKHDQVQTDVFEYLQGRPTKKYGLIVLDPPSLAKRETERKGAIEAYGRLVSSALRHLEAGGILVAASCSAHVSAAEFMGAVRKALSFSNRKFEELLTTGHPPDHPASFAEAQYLKCIYLRVDG